MADPALTMNVDVLVPPSGGAASTIPGLAGITGSSDGHSPEQLKALAAQFESMLMGQLMKEMQRSMFDAGEQDGVAPGAGMGPLADVLFTELSLALSRSGGLGLGEALLAPLARQAGTVDVAGNPPAGPGGEPAGPDMRSGAVNALAARVTSGYGWRRDPIDGAARFHRGVDLALGVGSDVPSLRGGEVSFAGEVPGYGLTVVVKHDARTSTRYAHLSEILVQPGASVASGETIARSGATGRTTGPHLHLEVLEDGQPVDPSSIKVQRRVAD